MKISSGSPFPLGATPSPDGTNFAVVSGGDDVVLCLFDAAGGETRVPLEERDGDVRHGFLPGVGAGQAYGYRVGGPYEPGRGLRCNPAKLLLDPYARAVAGEVRYGPEILGYAAGNPDAPSGLDSGGHVPRSLVVDTAHQFGERPRHAYADTVIYEVHVKGFTATHPGVPGELRGTYAGLAHDAALAHLTGLGVTAVELLPVHQSVPEGLLRERGLTNYWGYNTIGYFAPHAGYSAAVRAGRPGGQVAEFQAMVDALHGAGLEVILDVVFNHTAEGNHLGPTLSHRGLHNPAYYRLDPDDLRYYVDTTGTGNSLNAGHPVTLQLIMDSLRYWLTEMGVDGFRFDLAPTLARQEGGFDTLSAFFDLVAQDPVVSRAKLIAEPWDVGQGDSYDLGRFPPLWSEWNGRYRDVMRDFWRSHDGLIGEFAARFAGSSDLYQAAGRRPTASVNLITVHDGFTLADLVSYDSKHNEANGEDNHDGTDDNRSWNCGAEGPTADPEVVALRDRQRRAMLTTLLLSFGVPMLLGGDELGRTQRGNNNAYCQDNEISWYHWSAPDRQLTAFTRTLIELRRTHPVFRRRRFLTGVETAELGWFTPAGTPMTIDDWRDPGARCLTLYLDGADAPDQDEQGDPLLDDDFLITVNAWWEPVDFVLPGARDGRAWQPLIDTYEPTGSATGGAVAAGARVTVRPRSIVVLHAG
ncbi:glycogen debranching protein GlgX [Actinoplanes subtropicus]|uniref:glycogen debranching protein GlgX n=1 Tax=Actinoplanes subtropicus TaxID=543632 RepID=UPI0004C466E0|nr:glycogen debranching protein GlgX [Actinoplanes subtropicus]